MLDRILFGTDADAELETYQLYARFLETDDEYFNYNTSLVPGQGRWYVYGLYLPDEVLQKIYFHNANRHYLQKGASYESRAVYLSLKLCLSPRFGQKPLRP